jgi:peptide chain release factor subunit 1
MKITLYMKAGENLDKRKRFIASEIAQARNIKSKDTREEVLDGLRAIRLMLNRRALSSLPTSAGREWTTHGIVFFADGSDVSWEIPPTPFVFSLYFCGRDFLVEPYNELVDDAKGKYTGIIVIDAREAAVGVGRGKAVLSLGHKFSNVMGKHRAGGMSSARFGRGRQEQLKAWRREVIALSVALWRNYDIENVIIGGSGFEKQKVLKEISYSGTLVSSEYCDMEYGLREAWARFTES